jgi:hypothetical protein
MYSRIVGEHVLWSFSFSTFLKAVTQFEIHFYLHVVCVLLHKLLHGV